MKRPIGKLLKLLGEFMYHKKLEADIRCPLEYGLEVFGGKWKSRVICVLADKKTLRYSELRAELVNITDAVLSTTLKALILYQGNHMTRFRQELNIHLRKRACL